MSQVRVQADADGVAVLTWDPAVFEDPDALTVALAATADGLLGRGLRRLEVSVPGIDRAVRRAVLRAGFRLEGMRRQAVARADGFDDLVCFARLADDTVGGPAGFSGVMNTVLPRTRLIAHVVIRDAAGRVLLCETRFKLDWELPGGVVERGEPPRVGAERELIEELGFARPLGRLLVADWMPPYLGWDDAVELLFDGGTIGAAELTGLTLQPSEILRVRLCCLDEAATLLTPLAHRRLSVALGLGPGAFAYLEDGTPPA